jgi:metal transporter CNNM
MTPINEVFMLSIDSKLDYQLLKKICMTGHSRVPVYEEVDVPVQQGKAGKGGKIQKAKKIVGILLVKQCVLLDPKGSFPSSPEAQHDVLMTMTNRRGPPPQTSTQQSPLRT